MSNTRDRSDDRPVRGRGWKFMAGLITAGLGAGMAGVGLNAGATRLGDVFSDANAGIVTGIGFGVFMVGLMIAWKLRPGGPASRGEDEPGKRERMQEQRAMQLWLFPMITLLFLYQSTRAIPLILAGDEGLSNYVSVLLPVIYAWLAASGDRLGLSGADVGGHPRPRPRPVAAGDWLHRPAVRPGGGGGDGWPALRLAGPGGRARRWVIPVFPHASRKSVPPPA